MATNKVKPDPDALERQVRRQRAEVRKSRVRAYVAVAAVLVLLGAAVFAFSRVVGKNDKVPDNQGVNNTVQPFLPSLPDGATPQVPATVDLGGKQTSTMHGVPLDAYAPSVSLDGNEMAFVAEPTGIGNDQIVLMDTDGSGAHFISTPTIDVGSVAISPDGSQIAFEGTVEGNTDIYVVNADGANIRRLTDSPATDQYPAWSPDGGTIAYDNAGKNEDTQDPQFSKTAEIYTVTPYGGPVHRITHNNGNDAAPSFSPNSKTIVDESFLGMSMMNPDGSHYRQFPVAASSAFTPRFSPNGKTIAFTYFKEVSSRPTVQLGYDYGERPVVIVSLVNVATGEVTKLRKVGMATDRNTPQWLDDRSLFVLRVPANGG